MGVCGIYKIENKINRHKYIGQSMDIKKRWREHIFASFHLNSKDYDMVIHKAIRKYGKNNFDFSVIEECDKRELNDKEIYWIKYYNSYHNGYNASAGGNNYTHLGNTVELYDYGGNYVTEYPNLAETARALNVAYVTAYQVLLGKRKSVKGFQLKRQDDTKIITKYRSKQGGKISVIQLDKNEKIITQYESAIEASRVLGVDPSAITKCCKGKLKSTGGFIWRYAKTGELK